MAESSAQGSQKAAVKVSARMCSHMEAQRGQNLLAGSLKLPAEFISSLLED